MEEMSRCDRHVCTGTSLLLKEDLQVILDVVQSNLQNERIAKEKKCRAEEGGLWSNTSSFYEESKRIKSVPVKQLRTCSQGYRLMDLSVLQNVFTVLKCPQCDEQGTLVLDEVHEKRKGLASNLV